MYAIEIKTGKLLELCRLPGIGIPTYCAVGKTPGVTYSEAELNFISNEEARQIKESEYKQYGKSTYAEIEDAYVVIDNMGKVHAYKDMPSVSAVKNSRYPKESDLLRNVDIDAESIKDLAPNEIMQATIEVIIKAK